jgi:hypothetical protein
MPLTIIDNQGPRQGPLLPDGIAAWNDAAVASHPDGTVAAVCGYSARTGTGTLFESRIWFLDGATWTPGPLAFAGNDQPSECRLVWDAAQSRFALYSRCVTDNGSDCSIQLLPFTSTADHAAEWLSINTYGPDYTGDFADIRFGGVFAYDNGLGAPVFTAGDGNEANDGSTDEAFVLLTDGWRLTDVLDAEGDGPMPRVLGAAHTYDSARQHVLMFGGTSGLAQQLPRTMALDTLANETSTVLVTFDPATAGVSGQATVSSIVLNVSAGGSSAAGDGLVLRVWSRDHWLEVGRTDVGVDAEPFGVTVIEVPLSVAAVASVRGVLPIQLAAIGRNGAERASVRIDQVRADVRLVLPDPTLDP